METNKDLAPIKVRVTKMTSVVSDLVIEDQEGLKNAINILSAIKGVQKALKDWKDERIKPIKISIKKLEGDMKPYETSCKDAEDDVKGKMITYHKQVAEAEAKARAKIAEKVESGRIKEETGVKQLEKVQTADTFVKKDKGSISFKKVKKFDIEDLSKLPIAYHLADMVAIRKQMNAGIELPGVRYYEEDSVTAR